MGPARTRIWQVRIWIDAGQRSNESVRPSRALGIYQRALSLNTPSIAAQAAISAQNAMAWNEYGDLVCRTRRGRGAHRLRLTDTLRNLTIADDSSFRHTQ